jgi:hypothetical protein
VRAGPIGGGAALLAPAGEVTFSRLDDFSSIEDEWRSLETSERVSFFVTWDWIGSLLEALPATAAVQVVRVRSAARTVAMALLAQGVERRRGVIRSRALYLNETGIPEYDAITLEHNGVVALGGLEHAAVQAVLAGLDRRDDWDETIFHRMSDAHNGLDIDDSRCALERMRRAHERFQ